MLRPKKNLYKEFESEKKFLRLKKIQVTDLCGTFKLSLPASQSLSMYQIKTVRFLLSIVFKTSFKL